MGTLRQSGKLTQSTALAMHNDNYHYPALEKYENHNGAAFDSVMLQYQVGNGTATANTAFGNHKVIQLSSGVGAADSRGGYSSSVPINPKVQKFDFTCKIQNIVNGTTNVRNTVIGVAQVHAAVADTGEPAIIGIFFFQNSGSNTWTTWINDNAGPNSGSAITVVSGDVLQIKGYKGTYEFLVNGIIVRTGAGAFAANETCYPMAYCASDINATVARKIDIDYFAFQVNP